VRYVVKDEEFDYILSPKELEGMCDGDTTTVLSRFLGYNPRKLYVIEAVEDESDD
jgi:hypothetical protein